MVPNVAAAATNHHSTRSSNTVKPGHHHHRIFFKMAVVEDEDHRFKKKIPMKTVADDDKADPNLQIDTTIVPAIPAAVLSNLPGRTTAAARKTVKDKGSVYYKLVDMPILYITPDGDKFDISTLSQAYSLRMC